ncbi:MAG: DNA polymerase II large subunit [Nanoarchaeota archaeon]
MNEKIREYYDEIDNKIKIIYDLAEKARSLGYDPLNHVEIPLTRNMAERVEGLIGTVAPQIRGSGVVARIEELEKQYGKLDWRVALTVSLEVAQEKFCKFKDKHEAMEVGIRVGLAYLSNGVVSSPLEGFTNLRIKKRKDGKEYFALMFSGPIRSAGTTITCGSILVADYIRKNMGYNIYDPTENEIKRIIVEVYDYHERITNLQYLPSEIEVDNMIRNLPVQIDGEPSEDFDVSNYKDLDRIETNKLRGGVCLVTGEALCQKAPKFWNKISKLYKEYNLTEWKFLENFVTLQKKVKSKEKKEVKTEAKIIPDFTYIKDLVAGRPVLTHPLRVGGFRLRYGRSRTSGYSSMSMHPATMHILKNYIGTGTQLRYERPGKSSAMAPCDTIEGPIVKLKNHNVLLIETEEQAKAIKNEVEEILFLGDFLVNYGEFFNRAHVLIPCGYNEEWWLAEFEKNIIEKYGKFDLDKISLDLGVNIEFLEQLLKKSTTKVSFDIAKEISLLYKTPLHPRWTYHWNDINKSQFLSLLSWLEKGKVIENKIILPLIYEVNLDLKDIDAKRVLELLGVPHEVVLNESVIITDDDARALLFTINYFDLKSDSESVLDILNKSCKAIIRDKSGTYIGARMGRPEKAKLRKLTGSPHVLFPVGEEGGRMRSFKSCLEKGKVVAQFPLYYCKKCDLDTIYPRCETCNTITQKKYYCQKCDKMIDEEICQRHGKTSSFMTKSLPINHYFEKALNKINLKEAPELIKGVRGTSNEDHTPENLVKGVLRAIHNLCVNKDGTIRYDMTEMPITAFKPKEIDTSISKLKELGYEYDIYGQPIIDKEQLIEIFPSDVILPACKESPDEGADLVLLRIANFIDDLLENFYNLPRFYNAKIREDLIGHIVLGLAPHTSAAIAGRIIGFSKTQGCFAHPMWHAAQRRDCEGDEDCIMLLLDCLINFSKKYLPAHRGATQDSPLVITSLLIPSEVDEMVFDLDICSRYPLELYEAAMQYKWPWEIKIEQLRDRLNTDKVYEGFRFTHDVSDFNMGVRCSAYKYLPSMQEKVLGQMQLAEKIRAVDQKDVARLIIERHFIRDIKGNLRKFSTQQFRCVNCNEKYRRPPLKGECIKCGGRIIFTVSEGFIIKYLQPTLDLAEKFDLSPYLKQSLDLTRLRIESMFGKEEEKQEGLGKWF